MPSPIAQRITDAQEQLTALKDQLVEHLDTVDDNNVTDDQMTVTNTLNEKIGQKEKTLEMLQKAEERLAKTSQPVQPAGGGEPGLTVRHPRPFAVPAVKVQPIDYLWRSLGALAQAAQQRRSPLDVLKERWGDDDHTRATFEMVTRTATVPADTVTSGWASQLVQTVNGEFFPALIPNGVYAPLAAMGGKFTFGRNGALNLPTRASTPTIAGSFVAQGAPIPVRQGAFTSVPVTPRKLAVISTFTQELQDHSTPAIEGLIREAILEDTRTAIDLILLDATAGDTTRPAGLRNNVVESANSATTTLEGMITDLKVLAAAIISGTNGNIRRPVWIMNPSLALTIATKQTTTGDTPYMAQIGGGTLWGWPIIQSTNIPVDRIIAMDASDFMTVTDDSPMWSVSDQATLHMEDTTPLAIGTAGTPNTVAAPVRSLWQTNTIGIKLTWNVNWVMRRTGVIAWSESFAWD